jgi:transcriptional regulator with XRE-family HTH domain
MDEQRLGSVIRSVRIRKGLRQVDLAAAAHVGRGDVSNVERGHASEIRLGRTVAMCAALDIRLDFQPRWRGGDLDRMLNSRHSAMAETMARWFVRHPDWIIRPEVSFSIYGERGVIDFVAWHPIRRALLLIELKTELVDIGELMATADRRRRLAPRVGRDLGWVPEIVGMWIALRDGSTNSRRVRQHAHVLRAAFPSEGRALSRWLRDPSEPIACLSLVQRKRGSDAAVASIRRVRKPQKGARDDGRSGSEHENPAEAVPWRVQPSPR